MDFKTIIYGSRDGIAKITINRPERMNGYNEHMVKEMVAAIDLARQDDDVRVLIITGHRTRVLRRRRYQRRAG